MEDIRNKDKEETAGTAWVGPRLMITLQSVEGPLTQREKVAFKQAVDLLRELMGYD